MNNVVRRRGRRVPLVGVAEQGRGQKRVWVGVRGGSFVGSQPEDFLKPGWGARLTSAGVRGNRFMGDGWQVAGGSVNLFQTGTREGHRVVRGRVRRLTGQPTRRAVEPSSRCARPHVLGRHRRDRLRARRRRSLVRPSVCARLSSSLGLGLSFLLAQERERAEGRSSCSSARQLARSARGLRYGLGPKRLPHL